MCLYPGGGGKNAESGLKILQSGLTACYGHLTAAASNGHRDDLTEAELAFVGFTEPERSEDRWRSAALYAGIFESLDPDDLEMLEMLRERPTAAQVDFMS